MESRSQSAAFAHSHVFLGAAHDENTRRTVWVVALTAVMMAGEIVAGLAYRSMALLADGFHMATHAGALAVAAGAYAYAKRHANDRQFTFGTGKVGDLAGFGSALVLGVIALAIAVESAARFLNPQPVAFDQATVIAVIGLAVNIASALLLSGGNHLGHGHAHDRHHHEQHEYGDHRHQDVKSSSRDNNLRSAYFHVLADAVTSVLAITALLAGRYLSWVWLDPAMGIVGAVVIARWSWTLMRDAGAVLLDMADPMLEDEVRGVVEAGRARITDLHVWRVGPEAHAAIVSVVGEDDAESVRSRLKVVDELAHVTVEHR